MKRVIPIFAIVMALGVWARAAQDELPLPSKDKVPAAFRDVGVDQHLNSVLPLNERLYDDNGQYTSLGQVLQSGRPVVLQLGYITCPALCEMVSRNVILASKKMDLTIGRDFDFVFVSIDPTDTPALATVKQNSFVTDYGKPESANGFHVLIGKPKEIDELCRVAGFRYQTAKNGQYAHPATAMVITPDGRISQYLDGLAVDPQKLENSIKTASRGNVGSILEVILQVCLLWDPNTGVHTRLAMNLVRVGGVLTVLALGSAIFWMNKHSAHKHDAPQQKEPINETNR